MDISTTFYVCRYCIFTLWGIDAVEYEQTLILGMQLLVYFSHYVNIFNFISPAADNVPPVITGVSQPLYYYTTNNGYVADWTEPTASDNSGTANLARRTHVPGTFFPLGTTAVTYVFVDPSNNAATVTFFVTVLECKCNLG